MATGRCHPAHAAEVLRRPMQPARGGLPGGGQDGGCHDAEGHDWQPDGRVERGQLGLPLRLPHPLRPVRSPLLCCATRLYAPIYILLAWDPLRGTLYCA
jgi:hypothetical protein